MPEADVLYSDVKFTKSRDKVNGQVNSSEDTTYSEVKIAKTTQPSSELTDPQQSGSNSGSGVTSERLALVVLVVLLVAAGAALGYTTYKMMQTTETLQKLSFENQKLRNNLTERRKCERPCVIVKPSCWKDETCHKCDDGWEQFGGKCFFFSNKTFSWSESRDRCRRKTGDLVKIDSREEQIFLDETLRGKMLKDEDKFWIGLSDLEEEGTWLWADGSPLIQSLEFWSGTEPDNWKERDDIEEDCGRMGEMGRAVNFTSWFDQNCENPHKYICEKQAVSGKFQCV